MANKDVNLNHEQFEAIKSLTMYGQKLADQVMSVFQRTGLDEIPGCQFQIDVDPKYASIRCSVEFGGLRDDNEVGYFKMVKGKGDEQYKLQTDSNEYEILFADDEYKERVRKVLGTEKPLPPNGLWLSNCDDPVDVDGGQ